MTNGYIYFCNHCRTERDGLLDTSHDGKRLDGTAGSVYSWQCPKGCNAGIGSRLAFETPLEALRGEHWPGG